jgi:hypothetical protein
LAVEAAVEKQAAVEDRFDTRVITCDDHTENRPVLGQDAELIAVVGSDDRPRDGISSWLRDGFAAVEKGAGPRSS